MDISKLAGSEKIKGKEQELKKLAESADSEKIKSMVDGEALQKAFDRIPET